MRTTNFTYDGRILTDDMGYIICEFDGKSGAENVSIGSEITFTKVPRGGGRRYGLVGTEYGSCITAEFDICKDPCVFESNEREITQEEMRALTRWLNRREFLPCIFHYDEESYSDAIYYNASFNIERIMIADKIYGLHLKMETDAPFGYGQEQKKELLWLAQQTGNYTPNNVIIDTSDEIGDIFPDIVITVFDDGDFTMDNKLNGCRTCIKNCTAGETITMHGDTQIIETSDSNHKIQNDFNWEFFRIGNRVKDRTESRRNEITASLPSKAIVTYRPIIKDTP